MMRRFRHYPQIGGAKALPYDAEVDYLISNGQQYIDLGIVGKSDYDIEAEIGFARYETMFAFGSRYTRQKSALNFLSLTDSRRFDFGTEQWLIIDTDTGVLKRFTYNHSTRRFEYGDRTGVVSKSTFSNAYNMVLFGNNDRGTIARSNGVMIGRFNITDGEKTIDLISVRKGGKGYMYDRVTCKLYGNAVTGDGFPNECIGPDKIG